MPKPLASYTLGDLALLIVGTSFAILCWQANRLINRFDALEAAFNASQIQVVAQLQRQETKIVTLEQALQYHLESVKRVVNERTER